MLAKMSKKLLPGISAVLLTALVFDASAANNLYSLRGARSSSGSSDVYLVNTATAEETYLYTLPVRAHAVTISGDGAMYVHDRNTGSVQVVLPATGKVYARYETGISSLTAMVVVGDTLYGYDNGGNYASVDLLTGEIDNLGPHSSVRAMAMDSGGQVWASSTGTTYYTVTPATGAQVSQGVVTGLPYTNMRSFAFGPGDTLYAASWQRCCNVTLVSINTATDAATTIGSFQAYHTLIAYGSDTPLDTDGDGAPDFFEKLYGSDETVANATVDSDGDGLDLEGEFAAATNAGKADTDGDGLNDGDEVDIGTDATVKDTDGDGADDHSEVLADLDPLTRNDNGAKFHIFESDAQQPDIHVDDEGRTHVVYSAYNNDDGYLALFYALFDADGSELIAATEISDSVVSNDNHLGHIKQGSDGRIWIVNHDNSHSTYVTVLNPSADDQAGDELDAVAIEIPQFDLSDEVVTLSSRQHPQFVIGSDNKAHIVYENNGSEVHYVRLKSDATNDLASGDYIVVSTVEGDHVYPNISLDAAGNAHIVWGSNNDTRTLNYAMVDNDAAGTILIDDTDLIPGAAAPIKFPHIVFSSDGLAHVIYGAKTEWDTAAGHSIEHITFDPGADDQDGSSSTASTLDVTEVDTLSDLTDVFGSPWYLNVDMADDILTVSAFVLGGGDPDAEIYSVMRYDLNSGSSKSRLYANDGIEPWSSNAFPASHGNRVAWINTASDFNLTYAFIDDEVASSATYNVKVTPMSGTLAAYSEVAESAMGSDAEGLDTEYDYPYGLQRLVVTRLAAGSSVTLKFTFPNDLPPGFATFKQVDGTWLEIPHAMGDNANEAFITIADGGPYDADGVVNGIVVDPFALGEPNVPVGDAVGVSGSGGGCVIGGKDGPFDPTLPLLALLAAGYLVRRRFTVSQ